jgi:hypothetical protein
MSAFIYEEDRPRPDYYAWEQQRATQENQREIAEYKEWWQCVRPLWSDCVLQRVGGVPQPSDAAGGLFRNN